MPRDVAPAGVEQRPHIARSCVCCGSTSLHKSSAILMPFVAKRALEWEPVQISPDWGLRDVPVGMAYPLCNSTRCVDCGLLFLDIRFDDAEMAALYRNYREDEYVALRDRFEPGYRQRNEELTMQSRFLPAVELFLSRHVTTPLRILDWGGDTGLNTPLRSQASLHHIFDISAKAVVPEAQRVSVREIAAHEYDLIVLRHVLEHIPFPAEILHQAANAMSAGTKLYIEVPHEELIRLHYKDVHLETRKRHWHEHINFFTLPSLKALLRRCGLVMQDADSLDVSIPGRPYHVLAIVGAMV